MKHNKRWDTNYKLLLQYYQRYGNVLIPSDHVEFIDGKVEVNLGSWVSYMRTRYRQGKLPKERITLLESIPTWNWGPIRPGPKSREETLQRDNKIVDEYKTGKSLAQIARIHNLSRQRIHQIVKGDVHERQ